MRIFDELADEFRADGLHGPPAEATYLQLPVTGPVGFGGAESRDEPVEDWGVDGDLDPSVDDPSPVEVTDPNDPSYVQPWRPPGGDG